MTAATDSRAPDRIYDRPFLLAYLSNLFLMISISLLFRYGDFVRSIGGDELELGLIVGLGALGAIACRIVQGAFIDRIGPQKVWLLSLLAIIVSLVWHLRLADARSVEVYFARFLFASGMAGVFGAWITFVTLRVPVRRVAEAIGVVGSSGFAGMALGPIIGDWIFAADQSLHWQVQLMFVCSAAIATIALLFGGIACRAAGSLPVHPGEDAGLPISFWRQVRLRHPWTLTLVGIALGLNNSLPGNFLRPFAHHLHVEHIMWFFVTYNSVAFCFRLVIRRTFALFGLGRMILFGLSVFVASLLFYLPAASASGLVLPAIFAGLAHAILYPAVIASGTNLYPSRMRGAATNLMLATYDLGVLVGSPIVGYVIYQARIWRLPEYPSMFCLVAVFNVVVLALYWGSMVRRRETDPEAAKVSAT